MAVYMIFIREGEVTDHEAMRKYQEGNRAGTPNPNMKVHAVYGAMETFEGEPADGVVILEFPDAESAKAWYFSEDYQSRARYRMQAAPYRCMMVQGI